MKTLKSLFLSLAVLACASTANAATYNLGSPPYQPDANGTFNGGFTVASTGAFTDIYNFIMDYGQGATLSAGAFDTGSGADFSSIALFSGYDAQGASISGSVVNTAGYSSAYISEQLIPGAAYSIKLDGYVDSAGTTYNMSASPISAVPEPAVLALMVGGLGLVGFMANRRRKSA